MAASYFQRKRLRELHSELRTVQDRIQRINTPGRREIRRLEKAGHYHDSCVVHDELVSTLSPLWKEQVRLEREINEAERWV